MNNQLGRSAGAVDALYSSREKKDFCGTTTHLKWNSRRNGLELEAPAEKAVSTKGQYDSNVISCAFPAMEFLPSWNMEVDERTQGYRVFCRVKGLAGGWSPWFYMGSGGILTPTRPSGDRTTKHQGWGTVRVDYLDLFKPATHFQFRVVLTAKPGNGRVKPPTLKRFFMAYSGELADAEKSVHEDRNRSSNRSSILIPVPYRSQRTIDEVHLRDHVCCPTCVAMILEHNGINIPTMDVCRQAYDGEHKVYGVWPRAVQTAASNGLEGWIQRFRSHQQIVETLSAGQPVMASIRVLEGELHGAEYGKSNGHLILLVGFRSNGSYIVNDPYSVGPKGGAIEYAREDIEKVWLDKGGVGLIIRKPENS